MIFQWVCKWGKYCLHLSNQGFHPGPPSSFSSSPACCPNIQTPSPRPSEAVHVCQSDPILSEIQEAEKSPKSSVIGLYLDVILSCWRKRVAKGCYIHFNIMFDPFLGTPHFRKCSHLRGLWLKKDHRSQGTGMKLVANVASRLLKETQTHVASTPKI